MELGLAGRAAIVTGASRGIGRATAVALAAEGCRVLLCGRDTDALLGTLELIATGGGSAAVMTVDVGGADAADAIVEMCTATFGQLDILINNAGGGPPQKLAEMTDADWRAAFEINFFAAARLAVACANVMRTGGGGRLVHVSSIYGREPEPLFSGYGAAKAALISLSTSLSQAFAKDGVRSNCVLPGVTITEMISDNAAITAERTGTTTEDVMARLLAKQGIPAGRFGQPEEVAAAIAFLVSDQAAWISGATLEIDGGTLRSI